jgi:hypothetical protein
VGRAVSLTPILRMQTDVRAADSPGVGAYAVSARKYNRVRRNWSDDVKPMNVKIRRFGDTCRIRVECVDQARWLLDRLAQSFVFKTCEPILEAESPESCTFQVAYSSQISPARLDRLITAIPEVVLTSDSR